MKPKRAQKGHQQAKSDSIPHAASSLGWPVWMVKKAKELGCPAFKSGRVDIEALKAWADETDFLQKMDPQNFPKEEIDRLTALEKLEGVRLRNAKTREELISKREHAALLLSVQERQREVFFSVMVDQLPALDAGLSVEAIRENHRKACEDVCRIFREWAKAQ